MTIKDEALKLALEALEECRRDPRLKYEHPYYDKAITAIREALAEQPAPVAEPVATVAEVHMSRYTLEWTNGPLPEGTALYSGPQPAQKEPVAWHGYDLDGMVEAFDRVIQAHCHSKHPFHNPVDSDARMALRILRGFIPSMKRYTSPPASKPWVGLTDEERREIGHPYFSSVNMSDVAYARAIEAKLKEKNNG